MPSLGFLVLFNSGTYLSYLPFEVKKHILVIVVLCTIIIPLTMIPFFMYQKLIVNIEMNTTRERSIPLMAGLVLYFFCYVLLRRFPIPTPYHAFVFGSAVAVLCTLIISFKWKISAHMTGIGGLAGLVFFLIWSLQIDLQFILILTIVAAGLIGSARLQMKAHDPAQVYTGFMTGLVSVAATMMLY